MRLRALAPPFAALALVACAAAPQRPAPAPEAAPPPASSTDFAVEPPPKIEAPTTQPGEQPLGFWDRFRAGLRFASCEPQPLRERWEKIYTRGPDHFAQMLARAMPRLEYVSAEIEKRDLPREFVLLPIVESQYQPIVGAGGVAGYWQLDADTARDVGVRVDRGYDGRLDLVASTRGALDLLESLEREFPDDWRLADFAYNAGQYRVQKAVERNQRLGKPVTPDALGIPKTSLEHLAKLEALACIVRDPARFAVELPALDDTARLTAITLDAPIDFELASRLSGVEMGALRAMNPAWSSARVDRAGSELLLPADAAARFTERWAQMPAAWHGPFVYAKLREPSSFSAGGAAAPLLAQINGRGVDAPLPEGTRLYLPALIAAALPAIIEPPRVPAPAEPPATYRVREGDSLWTIAKRFGLTVERLCAWNELTTKSTLRLGQKLALAPPLPR